MRHARQLAVGNLQVTPRLLGNVRLGARKVNEIGDRFQRIVDLVRDGGGHAPGGGQFLGLNGNLLCLALLGNIAAHGDKPLDAPSRPRMGAMRTSQCLRVPELVGLQPEKCPRLRSWPH